MKILQIGNGGFINIEHISSVLKDINDELGHQSKITMVNGDMLYTDYSVEEIYSIIKYPSGPGGAGGAGKY